jgi:hypothetical protein
MTRQQNESGNRASSTRSGERNACCQMVMASLVVAAASPSCADVT